MWNQDIFHFFAWPSIKSFASLILAARYGDPPAVKGNYTSLNMLLLGQGYMRLQTEVVKTCFWKKSHLKVTKLFRHRTKNVSAAYQKGNSLTPLIHYALVCVIIFSVNLHQCSDGSLTSVRMVEDHQFSVSFSDLIPVGCGAERDKSIQTIRATDLNTQGPKVSTSDRVARPKWIFLQKKMLDGTIDILDRIVNLFIQSQTQVLL